MFNGKTVWIIGASSEIADAFLTEYGSKFGNVVLTGRDTERLNMKKNKYGLDDCLVFGLDLCKEESIKAFLDSAPIPDIIINFAGCILFDNNLELHTAESIKETFSANSTGIIILAEGILPKMKEENGGIIVHLSSCAAIRGKASNRIYSSSKAAADNYMQGLMQECRSSNVIVANIRLGRVDTNFLRSANPESHAFVTTPDKAAKLVFKSIKKNKTAIYYQRPWRALMFVYRIIPSFFYNRLDF